MRTKIIYIDDVEEELDRWKNFFEKETSAIGQFEILAMNSNSFDYEQIKRHNPDLILLDYDLSKSLTDRLLNIRGTALSTQLREWFQDLPIILFTKKSIFNTGRYSNVKSVLASIDDHIYKEDIIYNNKVCFNFIKNLAEGYSRLRNSEDHSWKTLLELIKAPENEQRIKLSSPPIEVSAWPVFEIAEWIRNILLKYPGILYDSMYSATFLGIDEKEFLSEPIQGFFLEAKYKGIFELSEGRWWKSVLIELASELIADEDSGVALRKAFPVAWDAYIGGSIKRSKCICSGKSPAEDVCCILHEPMMIGCSLAYRADERPPIMDESRISYKAIRITNDYDEDLFSDRGRKILEKILGSTEAKVKEC